MANKKIAEKYRASDKLIYLYVGRLLESKGILQLIDAFNVINKKNVDTELLLIGKTLTCRNGKKLLTKLRKAAKQNPDIHLIGYVEPDDLIQYQTIADCQIIPSTCNEAFGLVVLEAMSAGLPIIASRIGGIPEIGGKYVQYVDPENLTLSLVEEMEKIKKNQKVSYEYILEKYSIDKYVQRMYNAIHGVKS